MVAEQAANASAAQASRQPLQRALAMLAQESVEADARQAVLLKAPNRLLKNPAQAYTRIGIQTLYEQ